jgi:hypothetical protein
MALSIRRILNYPISPGDRVSDFYESHRDSAGDLNHSKMASVLPPARNRVSHILNHPPGRRINASGQPQRAGGDRHRKEISPDTAQSA